MNDNEKPLKKERVLYFVDLDSYQEKEKEAKLKEATDGLQTALGDTVQVVGIDARNKVKSFDVNVTNVYNTTSSSGDSSSITTPNTSGYYETCPGCVGSGIQENKDGIKVICPICGGSGSWYKPPSQRQYEVTWLYDPRYAPQYNGTPIPPHPESICQWGYQLR